MAPRKSRALFTDEADEASLLDIVDSVLNKGVVLNGDVILGVANVDLIYLKLSALLAAMDRVHGPLFGAIAAPATRLAKGKKGRTIAKAGKARRHGGRKA